MNIIYFVLYIMKTKRMWSCTHAAVYTTANVNKYIVYGQRIRSTVNLQSFISLCGVAIFYTANNRQISCRNVWCSFSNDWTRTPERLKHNTFDCIYIAGTCSFTMIFTIHITQVVSYAHARLLFCERWLWFQNESSAHHMRCRCGVILRWIIILF